MPSGNEMSLTRVHRRPGRRQSRTLKGMRRGSTALTRVPELVGLAAPEAHDVALDAQVLAVDQDPHHAATVRGTVTRQKPAPNTQVPPGARVCIWVRSDPDPGPGRDGGGGGSALPQGPSPLRPAGAK